MKKKQYKRKDMLKFYPELSRLYANAIADRALIDAVNYNICPLCDSDLQIVCNYVLGFGVISPKLYTKLKVDLKLSDEHFKKVYECSNKECDFMTLEGVR